MTHHSGFRTLRLGTFSVTILAAAIGCGRSTPTAPDLAPAGASPSAAVSPVDPEASGATFLLSAGTFVIIDDAGAQLSGVYTGQSGSGHGRKTSLTLQVTNGTGALAGATGTLDGRGSGAFTGEGSFLLSLSGSIVTDAAPKGHTFRSNLQGVSTVSCSNTGHILVHQEGHGTSDRGRSVGAKLQHEVGNTGCSG
jgi:hypothetical protein